MNKLTLSAIFTLQIFTLVLVCLMFVSNTKRQKEDNAAIETFKRESERYSKYISDYNAQKARSDKDTDEYNKKMADYEEQMKLYKKSQE